MEDVVSPTHGLSEGNSILESSEVHLHIVPGVVGASAPPHECRSEMTLCAEIDSPADAIALVCWVAVNMLSLWHVDTADSVSLNLIFPWS